MRTPISMSDPRIGTITSRHSLPIVIPIFLVALAVLLAGCSKSGDGGASGGATGIHIKAPGMDERDITVKSGAGYASTKTFTDIDRKITTAASYRVYVASYDLDPSQYAMSLEKPLTADDQARVDFSIIGEEGGTEASPLKPGTYTAKADKHMKVEAVSITTRKDGKDNKIMVDRSGLTGEVKIASVSGDTINGELNLTSGETSIKGPFTAKIKTR